MKMQKDAVFLAEMEQYELRLSCEYCVHFNGHTERCSLLWPNGDHLLHAIKDPANQHIIFCKEFDLN